MDYGYMLAAFGFILFGFDLCAIIWSIVAHKGITITLMLLAVSIALMYTGSAFLIEVCSR